MLQNVAVYPLEKKVIFPKSFPLLVPLLTIIDLQQRVWGSRIPNSRILLVLYASWNPFWSFDIARLFHSRYLYRRLSPDRISLLRDGIQRLLHRILRRVGWHNIQHTLRPHWLRHQHCQRANFRRCTYGRSLQPTHTGFLASVQPPESGQVGRWEPGTIQYARVGIHLFSGSTGSDWTLSHLDGGASFAVI